MRSRMKKRALRLASDSDEEEKELDKSQSWEMQAPHSGQDGLKFSKENFQIRRQGSFQDQSGVLIQLSPDDLEIGRIRGRGASGVVMEALYRPTGLKLAIKSFNAYDKEKRQQLMNDIKALENSDCPFLVKFYGAYYDEGHVKIGLELMDAGSLGDLIKKLPEPVVPEPVLAKITQQILGGLMYLHKIKHQVHRDIKPDNVLVNSTGAVKLTDFGISKELGVTIGLCNTFVGTMIYMSPERIYGKKYSYSSDIWGLGLMLLELSLGRYPYPKVNTYIEMVENIMTLPEPTPPDTYSPEFHNFVSLCVKKDPTQRLSAVQLSAHRWVNRYCQQDANLIGWVQSCLARS